MMSWGGGLFGDLIVLVVLALAVVGVWSLLRARLRGAPDVDHGRPEQILDERLARGEIDSEEYARVRNLMSRGR